MDIFKGAARLMTMSDEVWQRHANPWSVWTRVIITMPLLSLAIWSRAWFGGWAWLAVAAAAFWVWLNPRLFPPPQSTDNWASRGTFGERIFLERNRIDVPAHHLRAARVLALLSAAGAAIWVFGLVALNPWATVAGVLGVALPKLWFVDRMVWLYEDMKESDPRYKSWLQAGEEPPAP